MNNFSFFLILLLLSFVTSCRGDKQSDSRKIDIALELSGTNRPELEKVLHHYSQNPKDSLKLKAAEFLISNMTHHRSLCGEYIENHVRMVDSLYADMALSYRATLYTIPSEIDTLHSLIKTELDIKYISADFLIKNIEHSFHVWENPIYEPKIPFEDFCEFILPYKFKNEPLVMWKNSSLQSLHGRCRALKQYELSLGIINTYALNNNRINYYDKNDYRFKDERFNTALKDGENTHYKDLPYNRSLGVPVAIDFIPYAGNENGKRSLWVTTIYSKFLNNNSSNFNDELSAKVFRKSYSLNQIPIDTINFVPTFFQDPYNKDVTSLYQNVTTVEHDFGAVPSNVKYAYLAIFHDGKWCEVAWAELNGGKATFANMGRDVIYMPIYYNGTQRVGANTPILIDRNGNKTEIGRVKDEVQSVRVNRISYYNVSGEYDKRAIIGGKIAATNNLESLKFDTLATITHSKYQQFDTLNISSNRKYRYWLFLPKEHVGIAELNFYHNDSCLVGGITFEINRNGEINKLRRDVDKLYDNDLSTFWYMNSPVGIEFPQPVSVTHLNYISKTDGSGIIPGNEYELFYFNDGEWVSLSKKLATDYNIEFENVPVGALLWVHDYGKKCNERPFTIVNGRIKFW